MGYPQHWLLSFGGHQGDVVETWTCGIRMFIPDTLLGPGPDEDQYLSATAQPALLAWFARPDSYISSQARLQWIKFNEIDENGLYADQGTTHEIQGLNGAGGGTTPLHPLQVAQVLSWRTNAVDRGLASRGRIYSPRPTHTLDVNGDVSGPARVATAASAVLLLNSLDVSLGVPPGEVLRPAIVSRGKKSGSDWGPGVAHQIDRVVVDSSLDVQRRRSYQQTKEVTSAAVAYS